MTLAEYTSSKVERENAMLNPVLTIAAAPKPVEGGSCEDMQSYFNKEFGRKDTRFSNYEGIVRSTYVEELYCDGGVVIQSLPTAKKTCGALIYFNPQTEEMRWYTENTIASCFVSQ